MEKRLKEKLIDLILNLVDVPNDIKKDLLEIVNTLRKKEIVIPENASGKEEVRGFIASLFYVYPQLWIEPNKILAKPFFPENFIITSDKITANRNTRTRG